MHKNTTREQNRNIQKAAKQAAVDNDNDDDDVEG